MLTQCAEAPEMLHLPDHHHVRPTTKCLTNPFTSNRFTCNGIIWYIDPFDPDDHGLHIVLIKYYYSRLDWVYKFPGGKVKIEDLENPLLTLRRELREETGLLVDTQRCVFVGHREFTDRDCDHSVHEQYFYGCEWSDGYKHKRSNLGDGNSLRTTPCDIDSNISEPVVVRLHDFIYGDGTVGNIRKLTGFHRAMLANLLWCMYLRLRSVGDSRAYAMHRDFKSLQPYLDKPFVPEPDLYF